MAECKHEEGARCKLLGLSLGPRECIGVNEASCPLALLAARAEAAEVERNALLTAAAAFLDAMAGDWKFVPDLESGITHLYHPRHEYPEMEGIGYAVGLNAAVTEIRRLAGMRSCPDCHEQTRHWDAERQRWFCVCELDRGEDGGG